MYHFFGEVTCPRCQSENRIVIDKNSKNDRFVMLGDIIEEEIEQKPFPATCEYCFEEFKTYVLIKEDVFSRIANSTQYKEYMDNPSQLKKAKKGQGLKNEEHAEYHMTHHFTLSFEQQPYRVDEHVYLAKEKWEVLSSFKKEHSERDPEKRMDVIFEDSYYYELEDEQGKRRWLEVKNNGNENASLKTEPPVVMPYETLYDISDSEFKSSLLFIQEAGNQYTLQFYHHLSGIQMVVVRSDNQLVLDLLGDSVEELYEEWEHWLQGEGNGEMEYVSSNDSDYQPE